ncbi:uncharacterized protein LOC131631355 [Vicia villosa]|uniref:uncharacterized protein LOC131631355 n=1 Tax=Vicia villosa TaxID=3911 RepID=UPI00273C7736|nr:uncharacterized protein LOC131631355 [Vicia villosa]
MKTRIADLWRPVKGVTIKEAKEGLFLFHFSHNLDMEAALKGGPWTFDSHLLILERLHLGIQIENIQLNQVDFWVQVHHLLAGLMLEKVGKAMGNFIGVFVEYDKNNNTSFWREYMRVRVRIDVRQPLKKQTRVKNKGGEWCVVKFKYEKLSLFCFVCGLLGHSEQRCEVRFAMDQDNGSREWSNELRVESRRHGGVGSSRWLREEKAKDNTKEGNVFTSPARATYDHTGGSENGDTTEGVPHAPIGHVFRSSVMTNEEAIDFSATNKGALFDDNAIDVEGRSGGIAVLWNNKSRCSVMNFSRNFINLHIQDDFKGEWRLTCYYGFLERVRRRDAWNMLRDLRDMAITPWCIIGDFNDLLSQQDKRGNLLHPNWLCNGFRQAVNECDLTDISLEGYQFTWTKSRGKDHMVEERLDRALANSGWLSVFPNAKLVNLVASHSDHSPILLNNDPIQVSHIRRGFKFENCWLLEDEIEEVVHKGWCNGERTDVVHRISTCTSEIEKWNRIRRSKEKEVVEGCQAKMEYYRMQNDQTSAMRYFEAEAEYNKALVKEHAYWRQRAKMHWLREGDLNTKFFHLSATARRKFKRIEALTNDNGEEVKDQETICGIAKDYFTKLFEESVSSYEPVLKFIQPTISNDDNNMLLAPIRREELFEAVNNMHPDKSPGPDGLNPTFYQNFWHVCGEDIFAAVRVWFERGSLPATNNDTNICLIPKCSNPSSMKDLRPIALCNVIYKIISKLLANRMKKCLAKTVSEEQSAFVEGRSILDNAMIAIEIIHSLKRKTKGNKAHLALKIDMSNAYDRVDWGFLRCMLSRMGFADKWIQWVMMCVTTVNYSILVNTEIVGPIQPGRGLRQGDPLSPYLFILISEGLSALIKGAVAKGDIHGVQICRGAPSVSHLLFADDCFLFCRASISEVTNIMEILKTYEAASGQEVNLNKSEVFFSRNLSIPAQEDIARIMGVRHVLGTGTYLGLPSMIGRSKKATFEFIKDRIWKRINSWKGRSLSKAGKEVMIKSVLQSIPSYIMSIFIIPDGVINDIERMLNTFWWGGGSNNKGIRWGIGDGSTIPVMGEPWLRGKVEGYVKGPQQQGVYDLKINQLMVPNLKQWDGHLIRSLFDNTVSEDILQVSLREEVMEDRWIWKEDQKGVYSVRSGLHDIIISRLHSFHDVKSIILDICTNEDSRTAGRFAVMIDVLWNNRNNAIWNHEREEVDTLGLQALYRWQDWVNAQDWKQNGEMDQARSVWTPPDTGWVKCNVDAGFSNNRGTTNRGWCVRNNQGNFILAGSAWDSNILSVDEAEAVAIKEAIQEAIVHHLDKVIFESDSLRVIQAIHSTHSGNSEFSLIILSIQRLLQCNSNFEVKFIKRQANMVAHMLAKAANSWSRRISFNVPPPCIEHILINEMS